MLEEKINSFFSDYESLFNSALNGEANVAGIQSAFASHYIEASPSGINPGANDFLFRLSIPKGYRYYRKLGMRSIKANSRDILSLDSYHYLVKVSWSAWYVMKDESSQTVDFTVVYILQHLNNELKIFSYITGDEQRLLREKGIIE